MKKKIIIKNKIPKKHKQVIILEQKTEEIFKPLKHSYKP